MTRRSFPWLAEACSQLLIFCLAWPIHCSDLKPGGQNVCSTTTQHTVTQSQATRYWYDQTYYTACGFLGWGRCTRDRTLYSTRYYTRYLITYRSHYFCCHGWTRRGEECPEAVRCPKPPTLGNGTSIGHARHYKGVIQYSCNAGYCLNGNASITCAANGKWTTNLGTCTRTLCPLPAELSNGSYSIDSRELRGVVAYRCNVGFSLVGSAKRTCENGHPNVCEVKWSDRPPQCQSRDCGLLPSLTNGKTQVLSGDGRRYPSHVQHSCNIGYYLIGSLEFRSCHHTGNWNGKMPNCKPIYCGALRRPVNGIVVGTTYTYGTVALFSCHKGYRLVGRDKLVCTHLGQWTAAAPTCTRTSCLPVTNFPNGKISASGNLVGDFIAFVCFAGYVLEGPSRLICAQPKNGFARWNGKSPMCRAVQCKRPLPPANGFVSSDDYYYPNYIVYRCKEGFFLSGDGFYNRRQCNSSGMWTGTSPSCDPIRCSSPSIPVNGRVIGVDFSFNRTITFSCVEGYQLVGSRRSTCQVNGYWSHNSPTCLALKCRPPSAPINGRVLVSGQQYNDRSVYMCHPGYRLIGVSVRVCKQLGNGGTWTGTTPRCKPVRCPPLLPPSNGRLLGYLFYYKKSVKYVCNFGFTAVPETIERQCTAFGHWTGSAPTCEDKCAMANVVCSKNEVCGVDVDGRPRCACMSPLDCSKDFVPVCGSDGKTYMNECYLKATACNLRQSDLSIAGKGECTFNCNVCHKLADCLDNMICRCKPQFIGDGRYCCSEDLENQVTIVGAAALFRCNTDCKIPYSSVSWYFNGARLNMSQGRYVVAKGGMDLYFANVSTADSGVYTCEIAVGHSTHRRYQILEVSDGRQRTESMADCSSNCGKSCARKRFIARGEGTHPGEFPWQAMLCTPSQGQHCGGVLVSSQCVVTAAHCVVHEGSRISNINVCLGRHCGNCSEVDPEGNPQCFKPSSVVVHPDFHRSTLEHDIAVLKLSRPPSCDCTSVMPVCLPDQSRDGTLFKVQSEGIVTGWGKVNSTISRSRCLRKGSVRLASRRICSMRHISYPVADSMMCATDYNGACEGDSGGPLVLRNRDYGDRYVLAGIVSWGEGCGMVKKLGVYTRVLSHLDWLKKACDM